MDPFATLQLKDLWYISDLVAFYSSDVIDNVSAAEVIEVLLLITICLVQVFYFNLLYINN